ncbi:unnamed protein product [Chrysoparadoxa australica]
MAGREEGGLTLFIAFCHPSSQLPSTHSACIAHGSTAHCLHASLKLKAFAPLVILLSLISNEKGCLHLGCWLHGVCLDWSQEQCQ